MISFLAIFLSGLNINIMMASKLLWNFFFIFRKNLYTIAFYNGQSKFGILFLGRF